MESKVYEHINIEKTVLRTEEIPNIIMNYQQQHQLQQTSILCTNNFNLSGNSSSSHINSNSNSNVSEIQIVNKPF